MNGASPKPTQAATRGRHKLDGRKVRLCMRPDLVSVTTHHRHESAVVIKDPIAMKYYRLRPDEFFVLQSLRRGVSLQALCDSYHKQHPNAKVTPAEMNNLLLRFHRLGLVVSEAAEQGERLLDKWRVERKHRLTGLVSNLLFIRFPGVDPDPLLRRLYPLVRPLLSPAGAMLAVTIAITAFLTVVSNWQRLYSEFPSLQEWVRWHNVAILAVAIGVTKVLHELGHAFACKHFGGECHQIGPMLLVFTPALYCDTSDSWMLPNRFARAAVGLAGMAAEVLLASLATLLWAATGPSAPHYLALNLMTVCGISTVLFNANPLLRYDGYYVLSDLWDIPNLAERSQRLFSQWMAKVLLGVPEESFSSPIARDRWMLIGYAVASWAYRWTLTLLIVWFVFVMLRPYRLESIGRLIGIVAVTGWMFAAAQRPMRFLRHPARRARIRRGSLVRSVTIVAALVALAFVPVPAGESARGRLLPREEIPIFLATSGHLDRLRLREGEQVETGQVIAQLSNPEIALDYAQAESRVAVQKAAVRAFKNSQTQMPDVANELPAAETLLAELERQLATRQASRDGLTIRSPASGRLIAGPRRQSDADPQSSISLTNWSGDPATAANRGCFLEAGTELFSLATGDDWDAELILSATKVQRIAIGNSVKLVPEADPTTILHGTVTGVSLQQWSGEESSSRRDDRDGRIRSLPLEASYAVRVQLEDNEQDTAIDAPPSIGISGLEVTARVAAEPISIAGYLWRAASRVVRFR